MITKFPQNSKGSITVIIVGLIAIMATIAVGIGYLILLDKEKTESSVKDETADWEVYRNDKVGFELKYPKNFHLSPPGPSIYDIEGITSYPMTHPDYEKGDLQGLKIQMYYLVGRVGDDGTFLRFLEIEDEMSGLTKKFIKISIGNNTFFKNAKWYVGGNSFLNGVYLPSYAIRNSNTGDNVIFNIWDPSGKFEKVTNQILSSLKFTKY